MLEGKDWKECRYIANKDREGRAYILTRELRRFEDLGAEEVNSFGTVKTGRRKTRIPK